MSKTLVLLGFTGLIIVLFTYMASFDSKSNSGKSKKTKKK
ncbi:hypothetical protein SAMN02745945_00105 [Peptoclostridium litorale DSM 5388]|uniref:Uncharacterized protein n=1 Tax=Peptoclostridium litorale DSM 5388 TaxID=1121324 RepID=A0A069RKK6_PEPLI|nr:hypothetical protein CLIT_2c02510 [Peptoclostridium litorale DSM 5388]SIN68121.1 hypothetical protein SAMN02745945_00105 [Peptoclostridium litorale DSM 5388]